MSKTVEVERTFDYVPASDRRITIRFLAGTVYGHVIDAAAIAIEDAGAGRIVGDDASHQVDASHAFKRRR